MKTSKVLATTVICFSLQVGVVQAANSASYGALLLEKCQPLLEAVNTALDQRKKKTSVEATGITGGGTLSEAACIDGLMDMNFDSFMNISSLSGLMGSLFEGLKGELKQKMNSMACDFANDLSAQKDTFLSCTATMSVDLSMAGQLPTPELASCLGTGQSGYDFSFDGAYGQGSSSLDRRLNANASTNPEGFTSQNSSPSAQQLLEALQNKVDDLQNLGSNQ